MSHLDKAAHHLFAGREVGNYTVAKRTDGANVVVRLLIHHLSLVSYSDHLVCATVKSNNRWLVDHDLVIADDDGVGSSQVHRNFLNE